MSQLIHAACFDLECSHLCANFGIILCAVVKPASGEVKIIRGDALNKNWSTKRSDDSAVCKAIAKELVQYDILAAHNGSNFDLPFLRSRLAAHGLPAFPVKKLIDPLQLARNHFRLSSNSLASLGDFLPLKTQKTPVSGRVWMRAALDGDRRAMDEIVEHCVKDVELLEEVAMCLKQYSTVFNPRGSGW